MSFAKFLSSILFSFFIQSSLLAYSSVTITLINTSSHKFVYDRFIVGHPDNTVVMDRKTILPGESVTIVGSTSTRADFTSKVYFNGDSYLYIVDRLQFHYGQPVFKMDSAYVDSILVSRTVNPVVDPRALMFTEATIELKDKRDY